MSELLGLDEILAELILGLGLALIAGNGYAWYRHRKGQKPEGVEGEFRAGRVAFLLVVGVVMAVWGSVSMLTT
ncbi:MAG: hypothetical protein FWJ92_00390 [Actinomycetes bacterium]|jgi:hypothetical protein|nr:hypothetical protein [Acidimicrobiia bacterium]